jgi:dTDP-4-dehydrorhamnose 3,5-epimerase
MRFHPTPIAGVVRIEYDVRGDDRGRFKRHFCAAEFERAGLSTRFVQMNHSITSGQGSVRGMHYQRPPAAEDKLVSCTLGCVYDVALDLRAGSPTFLQWTAAELDEATALFIPKGCAHGFQVMSDEAHLVYLHSEFYTPHMEGGVRADDRAVAIDWPLPLVNRSQRDLEFAPLTDQFQGLKI